MTDPARIVARAPLARANVYKCSRDLRRGEVRRVMPRGPVFVGYHIACPGCGFIASYLHEACGFEERAPTEPRGFFALLGIAKPPHCFKCKALLAIEGDDLVAIAP